MGNLTELITWAFVTVNAARAFAYLPQIYVALRCRDGARSISTLTWSYFALAHLTGAVYSLEVVHDAKLAGVFFGNCAACAVLLCVVGCKRCSARLSLDEKSAENRRPDRTPATRPLRVSPVIK